MPALITYLVARTHLAVRLLEALDRSQELAPRNPIVHRIQPATRSHAVPVPVPVRAVGHAVAAGCVVVTHNFHGLGLDRIAAQVRVTSSSSWDDSEHRRGCRRLVVLCLCRTRRWGRPNCCTHSRCLACYAITVSASHPCHDEGRIPIRHRVRFRACHQDRHQDRRHYHHYSLRGQNRQLAAHQIAFHHQASH